MIQHKKMRSGRKFRSSKKADPAFQVTNNYGQMGTFTNCSFTTTVPAAGDKREKPAKGACDVRSLALYYPESERMFRVADNLAASKSLDDIGMALVDNLTGSALLALVEKIKDKNFVPVLIPFIPNYTGSHTERSIKAALNRLVEKLPQTVATEKNDAPTGC